MTLAVTLDPLDAVPVSFLNEGMLKERFLIAQYERMLSTGDFVAEQWRSSRERFIADMWDRTPTSGNGRRLEPIEAELGFSPDNVEWRFRRVKPKVVASKKATAKPKPPAIDRREIAPKPTKAERKQAEVALKEAKRRAIAEEYERWEALRGRG